MQARQLLGLCAPLLLSACQRAGDSPAAPAAPARVWAFTNADDAAALAPKLDGLAALLAAAARTSALRERPKACATPADLLALASPLAPPARGLTLDASGSCADAVANLRAYYLRSLAVGTASAALARAVEPDVIYCGQRVSDLKPAKDTAAFGRRLEAMDLPAASHYVEELLAGANGPAVAVRARVLAGCDAAKGDCGALPDGLRGYAIDGASTVTGDLEAKTVVAANDYQLAYKLKKDQDVGGLTARLTSTVTFSGLAPDAGARAVEHVDYTATGTGALGLAAAGERRFALDLTVEELAPGRLRLSGNAFGGDGTPVQLPFAFGLTARDDACTVEAEGLPLDEPVAAPAMPLTEEGLAGDWTGDCVKGALGRFGKAAAFAETLSFHDGRFAHRLVPYTDADCFAGHEAARVELFGGYRAAPALAPATDLALDYRYETLTVTVLDALTVDAFNRATVCGRHDWHQSEARSFAAGECYFDLGDAALMQLDTLKRPAEFTTARAENDTVVAVARTSHFAGDVAAVRATVAQNSVRRFKRD